MKAAFRLVGVAAIVASAVMVSAGGASGDPPSRFSFEGTDAFTDTSLCGFPIEFTSQVVGRNTQFSNVGEDGTGREVLHVVEQDTFSANGVTLVGDPYSFYISLTWVDFEPVAYTLSGHLEKVRLPDGSIFMAAGRIDLLATEAELPLVPDHGVVKNQDAFCEALSA